MKTCEYNGDPFEQARSHPWTDATANSAFRYYDLRASPALIRTSLEDFVPWSKYGAVERFYLLLEWLNGATSLLESNDCEFTSPHANENDQGGQAYECSGRLMVLFRELPRNLAPADLPALTLAFHHALAPLDPDFEHGMVGTTLLPVRYLSLPGSAGTRLGSQLMLSFWAWGESHDETMASFERLMVNLTQALRRIATV